MNRCLVGFVLTCALSFLWPQAQSLGADAAKGGRVSSAPLSFPPPPPVNDNFASATLISGNGGSVAGTNVLASKEPGEPNHAGDAGGSSVWWLWAASFTGNATFDTLGSPLSHTVVAVYTGSNVADLTLIACDDDATDTEFRSQLVFSAVAGTTYWIAVDGNAGEQGALTLNWDLAPAAPANDLFANATAISGTTGTATVSTAWATGELGEPVPMGQRVPSNASVWWAWTAPADGYVTFDTAGSDFDTVLGGYAGSRVASLVVIFNEYKYNSPLGTWSQGTFPAFAGTTYFVAVSGHAGRHGNAVIHWVPNGEPPNDAFANAIALPGTSGQVAGSNVGATLEAFEPVLGNASVWWSWTAPTTGSMTIGHNRLSVDFDAVVGVYTGADVNALIRLCATDNAGGSGVAFLAVPGTTYHIAVDGVSASDQGSIVLNYAFDSTTYTLTYSAGSNGSVVGISPQVVIAGTDGTTVTAVAAPGYFFKEWSDGRTDNPRRDTFVTANVAVTAIFAHRFLVQFATDGTTGATLEGNTDQLVFEGDDSLPVTARGPDAIRFTDWTLDGAGASSAFNPLIVTNVTHDVACVAHFAPWTGFTGPVGVVTLTTGGLELLDPVTQTLRAVIFREGLLFSTQVITEPTGVALTPDGTMALVNNYDRDFRGESRVLFVDLSLPASPVLDPTSVTLSFKPADIALTPDGRHAFVTGASGSPHIGVINVTSRTLTQDLITSATGIYPSSVAVASDFLSSAERRPRWINIYPSSVAVASDGRTVLIGDYQQMKVASFLFDPASGTLSPTAILDISPFSPVNVEFSPDGKTAIVATGDSTTSAGLVGACPVVLRVDAPGAVTLMGFVPLSPNYTGGQSVVFSRRTGDKAYYSVKNATPAGFANEILELDVSGPGLVSFIGTNIPLAGVHVITTDGTDTIAIEPSGHYLYVSGMMYNTESGFVAVVDLTSNTEVATIPLRGANGSTPGAHLSGAVAFSAFDLCNVVFQTDGTSGASLTGSTSQTVVAWTDCTPVRANAPSGYSLTFWSVDAAGNVETPSLTVRPVAANVTAIAHFARDTGTVVVDVSPLTAPWSFTDGDAKIHSGAGPTTVTAVPTGQITLTWLPLANYTTPAEPIATLVYGQVVVFTATYAELPPLSAPTGVVASNGWYIDDVIVEWDKLFVTMTTGGAASYRVFRSDTLAGAKTALGDWQTTTAYADLTAVPGQRYFYWVQAAVDASGLRASAFGGPAEGRTLVVYSDNHGEYMIAHVGWDLAFVGTPAFGTRLLFTRVAGTAKAPTISIKRLKKAPTGPSTRTGFTFVKLASIAEITVGGNLGAFYTDAPVGSLITSGTLGTVSTKNALIGKIVADSLSSVRMACLVDSTGAEPQFAETTFAARYIQGGTGAFATNFALTGIILRDLDTGQPVKSLSVSSKKFKVKGSKNASVALSGAGRITPASAVNTTDKFDIAVRGGGIGSISAKGADIRPDSIMSAGTIGKIQATAVVALIGGVTAGGASDQLVGGMIGSAANPTSLTVTAPNIGSVFGSAGVHGRFVAGADATGAPDYSGRMNFFNTWPTKRNIGQAGPLISGEAFVKENTIKFKPAASDPRNTMQVWTQAAPKP